MPPLNACNDYVLAGEGMRMGPQSHGYVIMCLISLAAVVSIAYGHSENRFHTYKMVQLTIEQRVFVVETFLQIRSLAGTQAVFGEHFPDRDPPSKKTIWANVKKYREHGTSQNSPGIRLHNTT